MRNMLCKNLAGTKDLVATKRQQGRASRGIQQARRQVGSQPRGDG